MDNKMKDEGLLMIYEYRPKDEVFEKLWEYLTIDERNHVLELVTGFQEEIYNEPL